VAVVNVRGDPLTLENARSRMGEPGPGSVVSPRLGLGVLLLV